MTGRILAATLLLLAVWCASVPDDGPWPCSALQPARPWTWLTRPRSSSGMKRPKTEHFIRQAQFVGTSRDFGFLVPTPNPSYVEAIEPGLFANLAHFTEPKTEYRTESRTFNAFGCVKAPEPKHEQPSEPAPPGNVIVVEKKRVGNLDTSVLKFRLDKTRKFDETADELLGWLNRNGYVARPELKEWLKQYIENNWVITAFKIAGEVGPDPVSSSKSKETGFAIKATPIRMTFRTERPLFPYREPVDQRDAQSGSIPRLLRVSSPPSSHDWHDW